jgi:hypothetical protein
MVVDTPLTYVSSLRLFAMGNFIIHFLRRCFVISLTKVDVLTQSVMARCQRVCTRCLLLNNPASYLLIPNTHFSHRCLILSLLGIFDTFCRFHEGELRIFNPLRCCCCCSCRWDEAMSLNCGHQRVYCSSRKWYMSMIYWEPWCNNINRGKPNN